MTWWLWIVVAVAVYLLVTMTPWILYQIVVWRLRRRRPLLAAETQQLERLKEAKAKHAERWPERPRPGRYEPVDRVALDHLVRLRIIISQADDLWPAVASFEPEQPSPLQVLLLGAWRPLAMALRTWRDKRRLNGLLDEGEQTVAVLDEQWTEAQAIPGRIQTELSELRAEVGRLQAQWQAEVDAGMQGLDALGSGLALVDESLGDAFQAMGEAPADEVAAKALEAAERLDQAIETTRALESELTLAIETRLRALESLERAEAGLRLIEERWADMQTRGANDPAMAQEIQGLAVVRDELASMAEQATPEAYAELLARINSYQTRERFLGEQLDALDGLMQRTQEALAGDVGALAAALEACEAARASDRLELDICDAQIAQAQEIYAQAEEQQSLGTWHGYQTALSLAEQARQTVAEATSLAEKTGQDLAEIEAERQQVTPEIRAALCDRADKAGVSLQYYVHHWNDERQSEWKRANALLEQADRAWQSLPAALLEEATLKQSDLPELSETLRRIKGAVRRAHQLVEQLEGYHARVSSQRRTLEEGLGELEGELNAELGAAQDSMLPEVREQYDAWRKSYKARQAALRDPGQINYDEVADQWLPKTLAEGREILGAYREDVSRYRRLSQETLRRVDKEWQRLNKLDPMKHPRPQEEDLERLITDYAAWQDAIETHEENPALLSDLVSRHATKLEKRIDAVRREILEGRQTLASLDRQYEQQLQAMQKSRNTIRTMLQDSQWREIEWDLADGESLVERSVTYQESSRQADLLDDAANQMRRAVRLVEEAVQIYQGMEQQLRSAQDKLNREFRAASADLDRAQRRAGELRQQGASEALRGLEERCASAMGLISLAQSAATFDDALRHLREAQEDLARG